MGTGGGGGGAWATATIFGGSDLPGSGFLTCMEYELTWIFLLGLGATGGGAFFLEEVLPAKLMTESKMSSISFWASMVDLRFPSLVLSLMLEEVLAGGGGGGGGGAGPPGPGAGGGGAGGGGPGAGGGGTGGGAPAPPSLLMPSSANSWSVSSWRSAMTRQRKMQAW